VTSSGLSLSDPQVKVILHIAQYGPDSVSGVVRTTGANLSTIQGAFRTLEAVGLLKFEKKSRSEKGQFERIFTITLPGFAIAISALDADFVKQRGPDFIKNYSDASRNVQQAHQQRMFEIIACNPDLDFIFSELAQLIEESGGVTACTGPEWFQVLASVRGAASVIDLRKTISELPTKYLLVFSPDEFKTRADAIFEYEFFSSVASSWRQSDRNLYDPDSLANFEAVVGLLGKSETLGTFLKIQLEGEREDILHGYRAVSSALGEG